MLKPRLASGFLIGINARDSPLFRSGSRRSTNLKTSYLRNAGAFGILVAVVAADSARAAMSCLVSRSRCCRRMLVGKVDEQDARPHDADAVVIGRQPGIAVGVAGLVGPDGQIFRIGRRAGRLTVRWGVA